MQGIFVVSVALELLVDSLYICICTIRNVSAVSVLLWHVNIIPL